MAKHVKLTGKIITDIQNALNDLDDFEVQSIKEKYSKKSLNPLTNRKNKKMMFAEVGSLLNERELARIREERRIEREQRREAFLDTVDKTTEHISTNSGFYSRLAAVGIVLFSGYNLFNRYQSTVRDINFTFADEEKYIGDYIDVSYSVEPNTAKYSDDEISIVFSNDNLVDLDQTTGNYNCVQDGDVVVKLLYNNKEYDSKTITIKPVLITRLYIPDIKLGLGNDLELQPTIEPSNASNKNYTVTVSDSEIVSVNDKTIHGVALGDTVMHLKSDDGFSYDVKVSVVDIEPEAIQIDGMKKKYIVGEEDVATVQYTPTETTVRDITWTSSNQSVMAVDSEGNLKAVGQGVATITATHNENVQSATEVEVNYPLPQSIEITNTNSSLTVGNYVQLYTAFTPALVSDNALTWSSSNPSVATVNENGVITAVKEGKATITAKTVNGKTSTLELVVQAAPVVAETVTRAAYSGGGSGTGGGGGGTMVWIPNSGSKFHTNPSCSRMKNPSQVTIDQARAWGYTACKKCANGY